jgi:polar amino acid transport system substrate-binding protein
LIYDEPLLRYLLKDAEPGIEILPRTIERQDYAFGLKPGFAQREELNRALLAQIRGTEWQETLNRYLGQR